MSRRLSLLAGRGGLVREAADAALAGEWALQLIDLVGREDMTDLEPVSAHPSRPIGIWMALRKFRPTHICMIGAVQLSDGDRKGLLRFFKAKPQSQGDGALSQLSRLLEISTGAKVVGVHEIVDGLLAPPGLIAGPALNQTQLNQAEFAVQQALRLGELDAGQALVMSGERVIATEDISGTDGLIARVKAYRDEGLTGDSSDPLILAKSRKPNQPASIDLPAIGPDTVENAAAAGISIIAVQSGQTLLIARETIVDHANATAVSVVGIDGNLGPDI